MRVLSEVNHRNNLASSSSGTERSPEHEEPLQTCDGRIDRDGFQVGTVLVWKRCMPRNLEHDDSAGQ